MSLTGQLIYHNVSIMTKYHKVDLAYWPEKLKDTAILLVKTDGPWHYNENKLRFEKPIPTPKKIDMTRFKVLSNVGLEYLIKAICIKRRIDIFKKNDLHEDKKKILSSIKIVCTKNTWLEDLLTDKDITCLNDIKTLELYNCIIRLEKDLLEKPSKKYGISSEIINELQYYREVHRNRECHITLGVILPDEYDRLMGTYNELLELFLE